MKTDVGMRVDVLSNHPGARLQDPDAQFLVEFARERLGRVLPGFELSARELPPAGVGLARQPLADQHRAVVAKDDADRHLGHRSRRVGFSHARRAG